ncbi:MAG TPA: hypothetical protein VGX78_19000 [Pirellulales bacterium]|jgi:hypothetical protein|nr:hypothetical protein [Pirellulales bacterium]
MPLDRRTFAKRLAVGAMAAAPAVALRADEPANDAKREPPATTANERTPEDLVLALVKRQYPKNLDDAKLAQIRGQIEHQMSRSRVLGSFPLTNADEPAPVFAAWRMEG